MVLRRAARVESLERRRLLSGAVVVAAPPAPELADGVLTVNGTSGQDTVRVDILNGDTVRVAVNGLVYDFPAADVERVTVQTFPTGRAPLDEVTLGAALARTVHVGTDRLFVENPDTDDTLAVEDFSVTGAGKLVTFGTDFVSIDGGGGNDTFNVNQRYEVGRRGMAFHGGPGDDAFVPSETGQATTFYGDEGDDSLDMSAAVPNADVTFNGGAGSDRVSCDGTAGSDAVGFTNGVVGLPLFRLVRPTDVELLRLRLGDGNDFATFADAPNRLTRIEVDAGAGEDALTVKGSAVAAVDDVVAVTPGLVHGLCADVEHGGFETLRVDPGSGADTLDYDVPDPSQPLATLGPQVPSGHSVVNIRHAVFSRPVRLFSGMVWDCTLVVYPGATADVDALAVPDIVFNGTEGNDDIELLVGADVIKGAGSRVAYSDSQHPTITLNGLGGADRIAAGTGGLAALSIDAGGSEDSVSLGYGNLSFDLPVNVAGGGGNDTLLLDDTAAYTEGFNFALSGHGLNLFTAGLAGVPVGFGSFEDVTFTDGKWGATVIVTPDEVTTFHVRGNDPAPAPGIDVLDRIEVDERGVIGKVLTPGAPGAGTFTFADQRPVEFTGMESTGSGIPPARLTGRSLFYNHSALDGNDPAATPADSAAVIPNRQPLFPLEQPDSANVSNYSRGMNGLFLDFTGVPPQALNVEDFEFRVGTGGDSDRWPLAPAPSAVTPLPGPLGLNGARYAVTWPDYAISNTWLRVTIKPGDRTGLNLPDVFFFGNLSGFIGGPVPFRVRPGDYLFARTWAGRGARDYNVYYDFDRSGRVDAADLAAVRRGMGHSLTAPGGPTPEAMPASLHPAAGRPRGASRRSCNPILA